MNNFEQWLGLNATPHWGRVALLLVGLMLLGLAGWALKVYVGTKVALWAGATVLQGR